MAPNAKRPREDRARKTTISVDEGTREWVDRLVGRFGRTQAEVVRAGLACLEQKLAPLPGEAAPLRA